MPSTRLTAVTTDSGPFISRGIDEVIQPRYFQMKYAMTGPMNTLSS
jgi:hypothetical protein